MKTYSICADCFRKGADAVLRKTAASPELREKVMKRIGEILGQADPALPPPLAARDIYDSLYRILGISDAYRKEKILSTICAEKILSAVRSDLLSHPDPFEAAARLAASGNILDYGVDANLDLDKARELILRAFTEPCATEEIRRLHDAMEKAGTILYILDNCGEAVFDRFFMTPFRSKITLAVRGKPVLNDVTREELAPSGLENFCRNTIDTGDNTPGIDFGHSSPEFLQAFHSADLVIAKGQGNFETLYQLTDRPLCCLFRAKCAAVSGLLNVPPLSLQILTDNFRSSSI